MNCCEPQTRSSAPTISSRTCAYCRCKSSKGTCISLRSALVDVVRNFAYTWNSLANSIAVHEVAPASRRLAHFYGARERESLKNQAKLSDINLSDINT